MPSPLTGNSGFSGTAKWTGGAKRRMRSLRSSMFPFPARKPMGESAPGMVRIRPFCILVHSPAAGTSGRPSPTAETGTAALYGGPFVNGPYTVGIRFPLLKAKSSKHKVQKKPRKTRFSWLLFCIHSAITRPLVLRPRRPGRTPALPRSWGSGWSPWPGSPRRR